MSHLQIKPASVSSIKNENNKETKIDTWGTPARMVLRFNILLSLLLFDNGCLNNFQTKIANNLKSEKSVIYREDLSATLYQRHAWHQV